MFKINILKHLFRLPRPTNNETPTVLGWGFFLPDRAGSCVLLGVSAEACGLRQPPELAVPSHIPLSPGHSSLRPRSLKLARSPQRPQHGPLTDQRVTRGRIKRLDCSIGWRRKRCGCVSSVHIDNYRREGGRNHGLPGGVVHCIRTRLGFEPSSTSRSKHHLRIVPIETREIQHPLRIHARRLADRVEPGHFLRRQ